MIGKNMTYNGQAIATTTDDFQIGLTVSQWKTLDVSDEQQNVQGYHGIRLSPTFARGRRITLEGLIIADDHEGSSKGIDYLETLFSLQGTPSVVELLPFNVTDEQDRTWTINAKIKEPLSVDIGDDDFLQGTNRRWRVVLQSEDPRYFNTETEEVEGSEGHFGGFKLGVKLGAKMDEDYNEIQLISTGTIETPIKIVLTALGDINSPLSIKNLTDGSFFDLDISAVDGDIIIIDSMTRVCTKNGVNILANRLPGSTWPKVKDTTVYQIFDQEGGLFDSDFDITITFNDAML